MKKTFLSFVCSVATALYFAQIPNFSFENWTAIGSYSNPDNWGTMNNTTAFAGVYTASQGTPGNPGAAYLKLTSKTVSASVVNGIAVSGQLDSVTMQPKSGFSFTQRPANFTGKWQHMIYGTSQGSILVTLTRWDVGLNQRVLVGTASTTLASMAMSWANFSLTFNYNDGGYPDTCIIVLQASGSVPTDNDYLWVDNLAFSGTVNSIEKHSLIKEINVYPNPASEKIAIGLELDKPGKVIIELLDVCSKVILSKDAGTLQGNCRQDIDVSSLAKGSYLLRVRAATSVDVRKVVLE